MNQAIHAWTDYPVKALGDRPQEESLDVRKVEVLAYDGNKYCIVRHCETGKHFVVKSGYLYAEPSRLSGTYIPEAVDVRPIADHELYDAMSSELEFVE